MVGYYVMLLKKNYAASRLEALFATAEKEISSAKSFYAKYQIKHIYDNAIKENRIAFLNGQGYWKDIYTPNLISVISLYRGGHYKEALTLLKANKELHPYFSGNYEVASMIFKDIGLIKRSQICEQVSENILQGSHIDKEVIDRCVL